MTRGFLRRSYATPALARSGYGHSRMIVSHLSPTPSGTSMWVATIALPNALTWQAVRIAVPDRRDDIVGSLAVD
ncbi:hypothetical protein ACFOY4_01820 [Actinomadura syzygii]|uniref:Uncharacterized protein n=1 Tax=Actinomadura syzygii TaxID=1427538 RepID=A0A5D0TRR5_9ACTN|nr:hypothetical protein [Actinomadura syzygii]TYC08527.1 hypothetical protein FXF65_37140 [Actinomadura syzygii]